MSTLNTTVYMNPLEQFEIKEFFYFGGPLLGAKFSLTNIGLYLIIVTFLILAMSYLSLNNNKVVPSRWSLVALIPLNIYSYLARALSLGLRLTANMTVNFALSIVLIILIFNFFLWTS